MRPTFRWNHRYEHYERALESKGLRVVPVEGDGNCLFRSVSHQVYGDDRHHRLVRASCMDYMEVRARCKCFTYNRCVHTLTGKYL